MDGRISGKTRLYGLIGRPVEHSGSPAMYNMSYRELDIDSVYLAFDVGIEETAKAVEAMRTLDMGGMNVTMPCKNEVCKYMDELSEAARMMGAVNTIVNEGGHLIGHNTDGCGFVGNLRDNGVDIKGKKMTICGGGGAATAIIVQCAIDGAAEISIFKRKNKSFEAVAKLAERIRSEIDIIVNVYDINDCGKLRDEMSASDIFVNATSVGMKPNDDESVINDVSFFHENLVVCDIVYNPVETKLLRDARAAGVRKCIGGKGMLLWQGVEAFRLYTGRDMPVDKVKRELFEDLNS